MICINPIAPAWETARTSPALSARITAHIHACGMPNRRDASATWRVTGSTVCGAVVCAAVASGQAIASGLAMTASHTSDSARPRMEWRRGRNRSAPVFARSRSVPRQVEHRALVIGTEQIGAQRRTGEDRAVDLDRHLVAGLLTDPLPSRSDLRTGFPIQMHPVVRFVPCLVRLERKGVVLGKVGVGRYKSR